MPLASKEKSVAPLLQILLHRQGLQPALPALRVMSLHTCKQSLHTCVHLLHTLAGVVFTDYTVATHVVRASKDMVSTV